MVNISAYFDESRVDSSHAVAVVAGLVSTTDMWCAMEGEWKRLLEGKPPNLPWKNYVQQNAEQFARIARDNTLKAISCPVNQAAFKAATPIKYDQLLELRIVPGAARLAGVLVSPYTFSAMVCCEVLNSWAQENQLDKRKTPLKVVFDGGSVHGLQLSRGYEEYYGSRPDSYLSLYPSFEDDDEVVPLQAAHLYAWLLSGWVNGKGQSHALDIIGEGGHVVPTRSNV